jgi:hypothetical protein
MAFMWPNSCNLITWRNSFLTMHGLMPCKTHLTSDFFCLVHNNYLEPLPHPSPIFNIAIFKWWLIYSLNQIFLSHLYLQLLYTHFQVWFMILYPSYKTIALRTKNYKHIALRTRIFKKHYSSSFPLVLRKVMLQEQLIKWSGEER